MECRLYWPKQSALINMVESTIATAKLGTMNTLDIFVNAMSFRPPFS